MVKLKMKKVPKAFGVVALILLGFLFVSVLHEVYWYYGVCFRYAVESSSVNERQRLRAQNEAVVVLTGGEGRIAPAVQLLRQRKSDLLIISGTNPETTLRDLVNQQGIPFEGLQEVWLKILMDPVPSSTTENAVATAKLLKIRGIKQVYLVTSDYHMWRAHHIFKVLAPNLEYSEYPTISSIGDAVIKKNVSQVIRSGIFWLEAAKTIAWKWGNPFLR